MPARLLLGLVAFLAAVTTAHVAPASAPAPKTPPFGACLSAARLHDVGAPVLMADFRTFYPHSPENRNYNLGLATKKLCGQVIQPGGTFSFNGRMGNASRENGYRKGGVFVGSRIVQDYGGGICQVASTLYNAVLRAGLDITEHHYHGLTVPYLPPGEDATISYGFLDFQFVNRTQGPVVLAATSRGGMVRVAVYGTTGGAQVAFSHRTLWKSGAPVLRVADPAIPQGKTRVEAPGQDGVAVETWVKVTKPDGTVRTYHPGVHVYRASPRIVRVGTGRAR